MGDHEHPTGPPFFVPDLTESEREHLDPALAEVLYEHLADTLERKTGRSLVRKKIFRFTYEIDGETRVVETGKPMPQGAGVVTVIFDDGHALIVCTDRTGVERPIVIDRSHLTGLMRFAPA